MACAEIITSPSCGSGSCEVCGSPSTSFCRNCGVAFYCCKDHQKSDWRKHKQSCFPVKFSKGHADDEIYDLVATRHIKCNEIFLKEEPLIMFPYQRSRTPFVCLECCKAMENPQEIVPCESCGWILCSSECQDGKHHAPNECKIFSKQGIKPETLNSKLDRYFIVGLLRALLLAETDPEKWQKLKSLNSFQKQRAARPDHQELLGVYVPFVTKECGLPHLHEEMVDKIFGIVRGNGIDLTDYHSMTVGSSKNVSFIFPRAMQTGPNCVPNARFSIHGVQTGTYSLAMQANLDIPQGAPINTSFEQGITCTFIRRSLKDRLFFRSCFCERCQDPTELGTYLSALKCRSSTCKEGYYLQTNPTESGPTAWKCSNPKCGHEMNDNDAGIAVQGMSTLLQNVGLNSKGSPLALVDNIQKSIQYLKKKTVHPNHFMLLNTEIDLCKRLIELSGMVDVTEKAPIMMELGKRLLQIADVIAPGNSRIRGHILYYIQFGMFYDILREDKRRRNNSKQPQSQAVSRKRQQLRKDRIEELRKYQEEVCQIFVNEPEDSEEAIMLNSMSEMRLDF